MRGVDPMHDAWVFSTDRTQEELLEYAKTHFSCWLNGLLTCHYSDGEYYMLYINKQNMLDAIEALGNLGDRRISNLQSIRNRRKTEDE